MVYCPTETIHILGPRMTDAHDRALIGEVQSWLRGVARDVPVVVVPVYDAYDDVLACARNLLAVTRANAPIVLLDDMSADARIPEALGALQCPGRLLYVRKAANTGFVDTINLAFRACAPHDVVIVNSDIIVPPEWLERLQAAAYCRSTVATATPFSNNGSILSLPYRNMPTDELPGGLTVAEV